MPVTELELRWALHQHDAADTVDPQLHLQSGRTAWRRRRRRRVAALLALPVVAGLGGLLVLDGVQSTYRLDGKGLTLAAGSAGSPGALGVGPRQVDGDRVDLGDGVQAWRRGDLLYVGYPARPYAELDTSSLTSRWGRLGYDSVVFDDPGQQDGSTIVVGSVRGTPTSVTVTIDGTAAQATVACFRQAAGWCSYKADVPISIASYDSPVDVDVR